MVGSKKYTNFASLFLPRKLNMNNLIQNTMRKHFLLSFALFCCAALWAVDESYYSSLNGKKDAALREAITALIYQHHTTDVGYNWNFENIDIVDGVVLDMYSTCSWSSSQQGLNYSGICDGYNREHTVPQNVFEESFPQKSDRHHLFLTDGKVNGIRSNYPFGETNATDGFSGLSNSEKALGKFGAASSGYTGKVYEPDDMYKGDIARAVMYMVVRYATTNECRKYGGSQNSYPVTTWYTNNKMFSNSLSTNYGLSDAAVTFFLKWHRNDKVSNKEIARNTGVENVQGNRNPFVDYPILVEYLWGNKQGETFYLTDAVGSFSGDFIPGVSDGSADGGGEIPQYTVTWSVNGVTSTEEVYENTKPTLPSNPANCSDTRVFKGWTANGSYSGDGSDLFTDSEGAPKITAAITFYAVYADKETSGSGGTGSETLDCPAGTVNDNAMSFNTTNFSIVHAKGSSSNFASYSPWRVYSGNTVTISGSKSITSVVITCGSEVYATAASNATLTPTGGGSVSASASSTTCTITATGTVTSLVVAPSAQTRWSQIVINYSGGSTTYSNYSTDCNEGTKVTITFHKNDGSDETSTQKVLQSMDASLKTNVFTRTHYTFDGWATTAEGAVEYTEGATINTTTDVDLFAKWTEETKYTVTFMNMGVAYGDPISNYAGESIGEIVDPTACDGYTFKGWSTAENDSTTTNPVNYTGTIPSGDATYYAVYSKTVSGGSGSSGTAEFASSNFSGQGTSGTGSEISATVNGVTFACDKGFGTTQIRCYKDATITISSSNTITEIAFTFSGSYTGGLSTSYTDLSTTSWTQTLGSQARITALTVTYSGGSSTTYYTTAPDCGCKATITITVGEGGTVEFVEE